MSKESSSGLLEIALALASTIVAIIVVILLCCVPENKIGQKGSHAPGDLEAWPEGLRAPVSSTYSRKPRSPTRSGPTRRPQFGFWCCARRFHQPE